MYPRGLNNQTTALGSCIAYLYYGALAVTYRFPKKTGSLKGWFRGSLKGRFRGSLKEALGFGVFQVLILALKGLKERPLKGLLGFYRGFMRLYNGYIRLI